MKSFFTYLILPILLLYAASEASANPPGNNISGRIVDAKTQAGITGAVIGIEETYLWAVSDTDGRFTLSGVQSGSYKLKVSMLGYMTAYITLDVQNNIPAISVPLTENTLAIEGVVVTAQTVDNTPNTTYVIGDDAFRHMQVSNVADIATLLPGGKTVNPNLTADNIFSLRDSGSKTTGNSSFGTAVEVDGVRIGNNASFGGLSGVSTRNISVGDIESIEVITGVPSAEYGDLGSGMVRINTRKGHTPWNIQLSVNPRTQQGTASKGLDLGEGNGVLNIAAEWAKATKSLTSPYESYTRRGLSVSYGNTFRQVLKFEAGLTGNIGGMNTEDDPDAYVGAYTKVRDNVFRAHTSLTWLLNKRWITNLKFDASVNFNDNRSHEHSYNSSASQQPAVHAQEEGYFFADQLPYTYFADQIIDSKELDYSASLKYEWNRRWGGVNSRLKAGVQWKANGNAGKGEYYLDPSLAPSEYRPRPYSSYPYMHNLSLYAEENITVPIGSTSLQLVAGLRYEQLFLHGTQYDELHGFSPRFNVRWRMTDNFSVRGGWGVTEKLPSYYALYPRQEYRDIRTFDFSYNNNESWYVYYTQPHTLLYNSNLRWQRNYNSELGVDINLAGAKISLVGYYNKTKSPYKYSSTYTPISLNHLQLPDGYVIPENPEVKVDHQTGMVYIRGSSEDYWTPMEVKVTDQTFVKSTYSDNGSKIKRAGAELIVDFPEIRPINTQIRFDAAYSYMKYVDDQLSWHYNAGWSHIPVIPNRSYQYVGIYANGGSSSPVNGRRTHSLDANITAVTHIPRARIIISCRLEMSLLKRSQNLSEYNGGQYAYNVTEDSNNATGGSIYDGGSYTAIWPVAYVDLNGDVHPFTAAEAEKEEFRHLIIKTGNAHTFSRDGYDPYFTANINITKEIGDHVALSFFANNFTNARRYKRSFSTGMDAVITSIPEFYYGLTCRIRF